MREIISKKEVGKSKERKQRAVGFFLNSFLKRKSCGSRYNPLLGASIKPHASSCPFSQSQSGVQNSIISEQVIRREGLFEEVTFEQRKQERGHKGVLGKYIQQKGLLVQRS